MIRTDIRARTALLILSWFDKVPDVARIGRKLINSIQGDGHSEKNHGVTENLSRFLSSQAVQDDKKQEGVHEDTNPFLPGRIFDVRLLVTDDRVDGKRDDGPTDGRPEQTMARVQPETEDPEHKRTHR